MDPGRLRHRLTVQRVVRTDDGGGGYTEAWQDVPNGTVWGQVRPISSSERVRAMQSHGDITHRVTVRYSATLTGEMRVQFKGRTLSLVGPPTDTDEMETYMEFLAREER